MTNYHSHIMKIIINILDEMGRVNFIRQNGRDEMRRHQYTRCTY